MGKRKKEIIEAPDLGIECLLSGAVPKAEEITNEADEDGDMLPVGWLRITIERTLPNAAYVQKFNAREAMIASAYEQGKAQVIASGKVLTDDESNSMGTLLRESFEAQFFAVLAATPKFITVQEEVWVAPPEGSKALQKEWNQLADVLGVDIGVNDLKDKKEGE